MPADILDTILDAVGDTPLVRMSHLASDTRTQVVAKVELLNPGGSPALYAPICSGTVQIFQVDLGCTLDQVIYLGPELFVQRLRARLVGISRLAEDFAVDLNYRIRPQHHGVEPAP